jgi:hypothetical protein
VAGKDQKKVTRAALLLALVILFQSMRFFIPVPAFASTFLIGSLVNSCLLIALQVTGIGSAVLIAFIAPVVAYFQQLLPLPVFILPVAVGNALYVWLFSRLSRIGPQWPAIAGAALGKAAFFYLSFSWLLTLVNIPPVLAAGILFVMGWPQLVTGILGGMLARFVYKRLQFVLGNDLGKN